MLGDIIYKQISGYQYIIRLKRGNLKLMKRSKIRMSEVFPDELEILDMYGIPLTRVNNFDKCGTVNLIKSKGLWHVGYAKNDGSICFLKRNVELTEAIEFLLRELRKGFKPDVTVPGVKEFKLQSFTENEQTIIAVVSEIYECYRCNEHVSFNEMRPGSECLLKISRRKWIVAYVNLDGMLEFKKRYMKLEYALVDLYKRFEPSIGYLDVYRSFAYGFNNPCLMNIPLIAYSIAFLFLALISAGAVAWIQFLFAILSVPFTCIRMYREWHTTRENNVIACTVLLLLTAVAISVLCWII